MNKTKHWYQYLWIYTPIYLLLGMFNIVFAWLGLIEFMLPLLISIFGGGKRFCNRYCSRGQLYSLLGNKLSLSRKKTPPKFLSSLWFRYGFLTFFMIMFLTMIMTTIQVFQGVRSLNEVVSVLWTFQIPWDFAYLGMRVSSGITQFAFGMYSLMLTSNILGFVTMLLWKPRSWCVYCPMGTMTQGICQLRKRGELHGTKSPKSS